jgi:RNA polymerase sigma-70 factor (ECF subfamily)
VSDARSPVTVDALLAERAWVRALARSLVASEADVDDVEQETWLAAVRHAPAQGSRPRAWLATVVRNQARLLWRRAGRRGRIERAAARPEATTSAANSVAHADALRRLVAALLALREPYRGTLLLRYFDGLSPDDIARREDAPVGTVKTRLRRGLELLRDELGRDDDDRRALLLLVAAGRDEPRVPIGGLLMAANTKVLAGGAALLVLCAAVWWTIRASTPAPVAEPRVAAAPEPAAKPREKPAAVVVDPTPQPADPPNRVRGRVVDDAGAPIAAAQISCTFGVASSKEDGSFTFDATTPDGAPASGPLTLRATKPGFDAADVAFSTSPVVVTLARTTTVRGHVFDLDGKPVAGAQIVVAGAVLPVDERGAFAFPLGDPPVTDFLVIAPEKRTRPVHVTVFGRPLDVYLWPGHPCRIRVVDEAGAPIAGASVLVHSAGTYWGLGVNSDLPLVTGTDGRAPAFAVGWEGNDSRGIGHGTGVHATCPGYAPISSWIPQSRIPFDVELRLHRAAPLRVHLTTPSREPVVGWTVRLVPVPRDATEIGSTAPPVEARVDASGDAVLSGAEPGRACFLVARRDDGPANEYTVRWTVLAESITVGRDGGEWSGTLADVAPARIEFIDDAGHAVADCLATIASAQGHGGGRGGAGDPNKDPVARQLALFARGAATRAKADERGVAEILLPAGDYIVERVTHPSATTSGEPVRFVVGADVARVLVRMRAGASLTGDVLTSAGWPLAGVDVYASAVGQDGRPSGRATTDSRGAFEIAGLAAGKYHVSSKGLAGFVFDDVEVPCGAVHLVAATHCVHGRIVGGRRIGHTVTFTSRTPNIAATTWSDLDGNFVFDGLADGDWTIAATTSETSAVWQGRVDRDMDVVVEFKK